MTEVRAYHHLSLSVTDLDRSAEWYRSVLGLEVVAEVEGETFRRKRLRAGDSDVSLTLTMHDNQTGQRFDERRAGLDHVAFDVGNVEDVERLKHVFEELGLDHSDIKRTPSGATMITLRDPDNIQLEVFASGDPGPTR